MIVVLVLIYLVLLILRTGSRVAPGAEAIAPLAPPPPAEKAPEEAGPKEEEARPPPAAYGSSAGLRRSFRRATQRLSDNVAGPRPLYQMPWYLVLGAADSHRPAMWRQAGLSLPFGPPDEEALPLEGCNWWLFDGGVVLDPAGDWVLRRDGHSADDRRWKELLGQLRKHRPKRPLDGVILPLSSRVLLAACRRGAEGLADLEQRAAQIYRKLWQTQRQLSIRFPVYVLIVDGQEIPGFHGFCAELPENLGREIFGWSSPHNVDAIYSEVWVDEAFDRIGLRLRRAQTQIIAARPELDDPDGVFLFPSAVDGLREPVRVYLNQVFKRSGYHESILCRGIYFCGTDELLGVPAGAAGFTTYFLRDLVEQKIFPEAGLARPTATALTTRNRTVRVARILVLLVALGLVFGVWRTWINRDRSRDIFAGFLQETASDVGRGNGEPALMTERASRLFSGMAAIDTNHFRSFSLPTSWLSPFDQDLEAAIGEAYKKIIFQSLRLELMRKGTELVDVDGRYLEPIRQPSEPLPVARMEEFSELEQFVRELRRFEQSIETFNRICRFTPAESAREQLQDLGEVVDYVFATQLPAEFFENSELYEEALRQVVFPQIREESEIRTTVAQGARSRTDTLFERFRRRLFEHNVLVLALARLREDLDALASPTYDVATQEETFRDALAALSRAEDALVHPDLDWAFRPQPELGPRFDELVGHVAETHFLGPEVADQLRGSTAAGWRSLRQKLAVSGSEMTGPFLEVEHGVPQRRLSGETQVLAAALRDFLNQSFMSASETRGLLRVPPGNRLMWDTLLLEQAATLYEPYERFRTTGLRPFPLELRANLERLARTRLGLRMLDLVSRAEVLEPVPEAITPLLIEPEVRSEITHFAASTEYLHQILGVFAQLNLRQAHEELAALIAAQGLRLLATVDELLAEEALYKPVHGSFGWWDGSAPVTFRAFAVADEDELEVYIELQRTRISQLAQESAQPLIAALGKTGLERQVAHRTLYTRWEGILKELYGYENKKPGNSVAALEQLIRSEMSEVTLANCERALAGTAARGKPRDYFLDRRNRMRQALYERCQALAFERAMADYQVSAEFFNQRLAGRFPFAAGVPGEADPEADPADVRTFFAAFDDYAEYFAVVPEVFDDETVRSIRGFVDEMGAVRDLFAAFLAAAEAAPPKAAAPDAPEAEAAPAVAEPVFDLEVDFRANRYFELGGDQIIAWELELGDQRIGHRDAERRGRWFLGQPVRLVLRWAKDAPTSPVPGAARRGVSVSGREVSFEYRGRWSLFSFLIGQASAREDFRAFADLRPHTLKFVVPIWDGLAPGEEDTAWAVPSEEMEQAQIFVRVALLAPDSGQPLALPRFPVRAPEGAVEKPADR